MRDVRHIVNSSIRKEGRKEGNDLFKHALNTFLFSYMTLDIG